ncbi:hypothetical protein KKD04_01895 [Patescibacteria group bacterium]|nr:hypothetical protein [Patescibacteria group bacterium]
MKPKIYFVVKYLPPLFYYEKLLSCLENYDVAFILLEDKGTLKYCQDHKIPFFYFFNINSGKRNFLTLPFIKHIIDRYRFLKKCDKFLKEQKPTKLIFSEIKPCFHASALMEKANGLGIETITLQWCLIHNEELPKISWRQRMLKLNQRDGNFLLGIFKNVYFFLLNKIFTLLDFFKILPNYSDFLNNSKKFGVFNEKAKEVFLVKGIDSKKITIVGNANRQSIKELRERVFSDRRFRQSLIKKYQLDPNKKNILLLSTNFYSGHAAVCMTPDEQVKYFREIIEAIQKFFPSNEANIIFSLHPRERNIYSSYENLGVKIVMVTEAKESIDELIALADLCIGHPGTTVNFTICASGVPAIFFNFTPLRFLDSYAKYYGVKYIVKEWDKFLSFLEKQKNNNLEKQYELYEDKDSIKRIVNFITS